MKKYSFIALVFVIILMGAGCSSENNDKPVETTDYNLPAVETDEPGPPVEATQPYEVVLYPEESVPPVFTFSNEISEYGMQAAITFLKGFVHSDTFRFVEDIADLSLVTHMHDNRSDWLACDINDVHIVVYYDALTGNLLRDVPFIYNGFVADSYFSLLYSRNVDNIVAGFMNHPNARNFHLYDITQNGIPDIVVQYSNIWGGTGSHNVLFMYINGAYRNIASFMQIPPNFYVTERGELVVITSGHSSIETYFVTLENDELTINDTPIFYEEPLWQVPRLFDIEETIYLYIKAYVLAMPPRPGPTPTPAPSPTPEPLPEFIPPSDVTPPPFALSGIGSENVSVSDVMDFYREIMAHKVERYGLHNIEYASERDTSILLVLLEDIDNDGLPELFVVHTNGNTFIYNYAGLITAFWETEHWGYFALLPSIVRSDDGNVYFVYKSEGGAVMHWMEDTRYFTLHNGEWILALSKLSVHRAFFDEDTEEKTIEIIASYVNNEAVPEYVYKNAASTLLGIHGPS